MSGDVLVAAELVDEIEINGPPPPPRYGHSLVLTTATTSSSRTAANVPLSSSRVWTLRFLLLLHQTRVDTSPARRARQPAPRYDHVALMMGKQMIVPGGEASAALSAMLGSRQVAMDEELELKLDPPRFGHAAAGLGGAVYVFGGYTGTGANPFTRQLLKCMPGVGCVDGIHVSHRFVGDFDSVTSALYADDKFLYVYGGSNAASPDGFGEVFKYEPASCIWRELSSDGPAQGRYEHASVVAGGRLVVTGGHSKGVPQPDVYMFPLHSE